MAKCEYEIDYTDLEGNTPHYKCERPILENNSESGKKYCIFHSKNKDKYIIKFYDEFNTLYKNSKDHTFIGFVFLSFSINSKPKQIIDAFTVS